MPRATEAFALHLGGCPQLSELQWGDRERGPWAVLDMKQQTPLKPPKPRFRVMWSYHIQLAHMFEKHWPQLATGRFYLQLCHAQSSGSPPDVQLLWQPWAVMARCNRAWWTTWWQTLKWVRSGLKFTRTSCRTAVDVFPIGRGEFCVSLGAITSQLSIDYNSFIDRYCLRYNNDIVLW